MRRFVLPLLLVASLGATVPAMAEPVHTTSGIIKALDSKACLITLTNKDVFHVRGKCEAFSKLKAGEKVTVSWYARNSRDWATRVTTA